MYYIRCWGCQILWTHFPSFWEYSWKTALSHCPSLVISLAGGNCLTQGKDMQFSPLYPDSLNPILPLFAPTYVNQRVMPAPEFPVGLTQPLPLPHSASFPFHRHWSQKHSLKNTLQVSEPASQGTQLTTYKAQSLFSDTHSHVSSSVLIPRGCTSGALLPLSALSRINTLNLAFGNDGSADKSPKQSPQHTVILPSKGLNPSKFPNGKTIRGTILWTWKQFFSIATHHLPKGVELYLEHETVSHNTNALLVLSAITVLLFAWEASEEWHCREATLELWSLSSGLISYRLTLNCFFFLSNFNQNALCALSLTTLNNWPFSALLSSLFSPLSLNRRGFFSTKLGKEASAVVCEISVSASYRSSLCRIRK